MKALALLALMALPAVAQAPQELQSREIAMRCDEANCILKREDWEYMMRRDQLFAALVNELAGQLKNCRFREAKR